MVRWDIFVKVLVCNLEMVREILFLKVELVMGDVFNFISFYNVMGDSIVVLCVIGVKFNFNFVGLLMVDYLGIKNLVDVLK